MFQLDFDPTDNSLRYMTKITHTSGIPPGTIYLICHSSIVKYLMTCEKRQFQYVGEAVQQLNERFIWHKLVF